MMIYTVDENVNSKQRNEIQIPPIEHSNPKKCTRYLLSFVIISISFIVFCCIIMAVMTASVFLKTNDLKDFYQKNRDLDSFFLNESSDLSNDQFKLERNMLGWLQNKIKKKIFGKQSNTYESSSNQYYDKYTPQGIIVKYFF